MDGIGYVLPDLVVVGSRSSSSSSSGSNDSDPWGSGSDPWGSNGSNPNGSETGGGSTGGSTGGSSTGGTSNSNIKLITGNLDNISRYSRYLLQHLNGYTGTIRITSTARTPEQQAQVMLDNIKKHGLQSQLDLYANPGDKVCLVYDPKKSDNQNLEAMIAKIYELGPTTVSHHCVDPTQLNTLDISKNGLSNINCFLDALKKAGIFYIDEPQNNCIHIEIKQK